ncbi:NUMOD3 domain-containing DNA-binding protein [Pseudonocardia tropica]|uniref:NUMOD3 domain-containing DNA-binding protein n=1 Tax=Pseudonocardia tropica TaxID=681289 RepID=A0ABV1JS36_9PSEU
MSFAQRNVVYGLSLDGVNFRYVGMTTGSLQQRWWAHSYRARTAPRTAVQCWIAKHGPEQVMVTVLERCGSIEELHEAEVRWIETLRGQGADLLNLTEGGEGVLGLRHSPEVRALMSQQRTGRTSSEETRRKISLSAKAQRAAELAAGQPSPSAGRPKSEEHKAKLRARVVSKETRQRMSEAARGRPSPFAGKQHTEESKEKLRAAALGRKATPEARAKMSEARRGKPKSAEHRARIAESVRRARALRAEQAAGQRQPEAAGDV